MTDRTADGRAALMRLWDHYKQNRPDEETAAELLPEIPPEEIPPFLAFVNGMRYGSGA